MNEINYKLVEIHGKCQGSVKKIDFREQDLI